MGGGSHGQTFHPGYGPAPLQSRSANITSAKRGETMKSHFLRTMVAVVAAGTLSACALVEDKVPVDYVSAGVPETGALAGAADVAIVLTATDQRTVFADRIGTKKNVYGMEMARIVATNDVVELVRGSLERELRALGFRTEAGGVPVGIELQNFYNDFRTGFWSGDAVAEVAFVLKVRDASGALLFSQLYSATGIEEKIQIASGENAKAALQKALTGAIKAAIDDPQLRQALLSARSRPPAPARRTS